MNTLTAPTRHPDTDLRIARVRVLQVVRLHGPIPGPDVNDLYRFSAARFDWPLLPWHVPATLLGGLVADGYASSTSHGYVLTDHGLRVLTLGHTTRKETA